VNWIFISRSVFRSPRRGKRMYGSLGNTYKGEKIIVLGIMIMDKGVKQDADGFSLE